VFCTTPASNEPFWKEKFEETVKRDKRNLQALNSLGWRVSVVWECAIKERGADVVANRIESWLNSRKRFLEISSAFARVRPQR
jgi:DNA mismatch endonuclease (patch repair protein)